MVPSIRRLGCVLVRFVVVMWSSAGVGQACYKFEMYVAINVGQLRRTWSRLSLLVGEGYCCRGWRCLYYKEEEEECQLKQLIVIVLSD